MYSSKLPSRAALALIAASALVVPLLPGEIAPAQAQVGFTVSFGAFHDRLGRYGSWMRHPRWGEVWLPRSGRSFRPYYDGHWEYTSDVGWLWVSEDPWGEITDHYGRWVYDPAYGWLWVPGFVWGPSWVVWREGEGYIGWFPMPPDYDDFDLYNFGPRFGADAWYGYRNWYPGFADTTFFSLWVFSTDRDFGRPGPRQYITNPTRVRDVYRHSTERTHYVDEHNRVVDRSIDVGRLEQETHRRIEAQPARRFLANIPTTSVTEGRDIARRNRDIIRGNAPAIDLGRGNLGRGNTAPENTGGPRVITTPEHAAPGNNRGNAVGPNRGNAPQSIAPAGARNRDNGARGRELTNIPPQQNVPRPNAQTPTPELAAPGNNRGNAVGPNRGNAPQGIAPPGARNRDNGARGRELTNIPPQQNVPRPNVQTPPTPPPAAARGGNRSQNVGDGNQGRGGGPPAHNPPVQAQARPQGGPPPQAQSSPRGGGNADRNDQRRRGRDGDPNP